MSSFENDSGFFQSNYYEQSTAGYDMEGNQGFGHEQQFAQFDYNQGYADNYNAGYGAQAPSTYRGSIMTPAAPPYAGPEPGSSDNYEDEPPLLEELGINFDHITQKTLAVLNPMKAADHSIMQDTDLAGPLVFGLAFGASLLFTGKMHFGYVYGLGVVGCLAMYALLNLMSLTGVSVGCTLSVLGYCLLPMVMLSLSAILVSLKGLLGVVLTVVTVLWCSYSASKLFVSALAMENQQFLVAYPCLLVYGVFALLTVF